MEQIDEIDKRILRVLQDDSRLSSRKIAKRVGISVSTVSERIERMQKAGIIKGFTALVDPEKIGLIHCLAAFIRIKAGENAMHVGKEIAKIEEVCHVYNITGEYDLIVLGTSTSKEGAINLLNKISKTRGVENVNSSWILHPIKESLKYKI